jgi:hypothetical protein
MNNFIARANIDHYLEMLGRDDIQSANRTVLCKLLIEEEDKLSHDLEQLQFAESRAAACQDRVERLKRLRDCFADGSTDRVQADATLHNFEAFLVQVESFCSRMRAKVHGHSL